MLRVVGGLERRVEYVDSANLGGNTSAYVFNGLNLGPVHANRVLIAAVNNYDLKDRITSVTIAQVGATLVTRQGPDPWVEMWSAVCPNFTTGSVGVFLNGAGLGCSLGLWAAYGLASPVARSTGGYRSGSLINLAVLSDAIAVGAASNSGASGSVISWTGVIKDFQVSKHSGGSASHLSEGVLGIEISGNGETAVAATWR